MVNSADELQSIIDNANAGDIIALASDLTLDEYLIVDNEVTLDLNGKTLTINSGDPDYGTIYVFDNLTIKDTTGEGKILTDYSFVVYEGEITVESGDITISNDYGIYCLDGGKAVINGGTITSLDSPLAGNNTTGTMEFEVNGGVLTAKRGPAIYMPGPVSLTITDGTLNGGISLRMGIVNISGGVINATTGSIDNPKDYYNYSGNAWLPDALYVFGGTYTSKDDSYTNELQLNITGGTFNCNNDQGSAVAIYDIGKVAQDINVTISASANLNTNSNNRKAYQVLSLEDIGVTPSNGYGVYSGNVVTQYK
jgi:hypothetical protein